MIQYQPLKTCPHLESTDFWKSDQCGIRAISYIINKNVSDIEKVFTRPSSISLLAIYTHFNVYLQQVSKFQDFHLSDCCIQLKDLLPFFDDSEMILGLLPDKNDFQIVQKNYSTYSDEFNKHWNIDYEQIKQQIKLNKTFNMFHAVGFKKDTYFDCIDYKSLGLSIENWLVTCIIHKLA